MQKGIPSHDEMSPELFDKFGMVLTGHYHHKSSKGNIHYLGSQMQFTWADVDDPKFFHVFDTETQELQAIKNPIEIYKKIRYNSSRKTKFTRQKDYQNKFIRIIIEEKSNAYEFDRFIEQIEYSNPLDLSIIDSSTFGDFLNSSFEQEDTESEQTVSEDTLSFMNSYIDGIETSLDTNRLKTTMNSIFREAEQLELN